MTFERPWLLLLTILPVVWCYYEWRKHKVIHGRDVPRAAAVIRAHMDRSGERAA